jgi:nitroreductase
MASNQAVGFLGALSTAALCLIIYSCASVTRGDLDPGVRAVPPLSRDEMEILYLASLAPNGHNTQPWRVTVESPGFWHIGVSGERRLPGVDPSGRETMLSIGAFLENLIMAAENLGYSVTYTVSADDPAASDILQARLTPAPAKPRPVEEIRNRRTIRGPMSTRPVSAGDIAAITGGDTSHFTYFPADSGRGRYISEAVVASNRRQVWRDQAQEELSRWIRWKDAEAAGERDGLTPEAMGITGIQGWYVRHFYTGKNVMEADFRNRTIDIVRKQAANCGGWLVVSNGSSSVSGLIETGRFFERMFIKVRGLGIGVHPMSQVLEEQPWSRELPGKIGINGQVQFVLRIGYVEGRYPPPVSLRRPPEEFVITATK